jgi:pimeloyl-ACP methyl ester carboxylesterase
MAVRVYDENGFLKIRGIRELFFGGCFVALQIAMSIPAKGQGVDVCTVLSSIDGTEQKALFYVPPVTSSGSGSAPVPLLVALHTWSGNYSQCTACPIAENWAMIAPDFRGPNIRPESCASALAVQDVLDAVAYARANANIDTSRIYLHGASGGGHMALMMAAKAPQLWAGVSAWVPISDLAAWRIADFYSSQMDAVCGGAPGTPETDAEYAARSPIHFLPAARGLPIDISAGIHDGHQGSVPISQSLTAFNILAEANGFPGARIPAADIESMTRDEKVPPSLAGEAQADPERSRAILFRRVAGPARITLFEGAHEAEIAASWKWLGRQRKGSPACFDVPKSPDGKQNGSRSVQDVAR